MIQTVPFKPGDIVKWSDARIRSTRDYWLSCGIPSEKSVAKQELDNVKAQRGTVVSCSLAKYGGFTVVAIWPDGAHQSASFLIELA